MTYQEWARRHPQAAAELEQMHIEANASQSDSGHSEARVQQEVRLSAARQGAVLWRNNVGATPAKDSYCCARCGFKGETPSQPVRYGLANDSHRMNKALKSSDLIGINPVIIQPGHVGHTIGQFVSIEVKCAGWQYKGDEHEQAQGAWLALVSRMGGFATFASGAVRL